VGDLGRRTLEHGHGGASLRIVCNRRTDDRSR
jgi:hypothetical protein